MKKFLRIFLSLAFLTSFSLAMAGGSSGNSISGVYVGLDLGTADWDATGTDELGIRFFAGIDINKNLGVELGYADLGTHANVDITGIYLAAVGKIPLNNKASLFGKLGFFSWEADYPTGTSDGTDIMLGLGAQFNLNKNVDLKAEYTNYSDISGSDIDMFSVGVVYKFN